MYAPELSDRALEQRARELGFTLTRHSPTQIDAAIAALNDLLDEDRGLKRPLAPDEIQFIENERALCALDFRYYLNYCWIVNWRKEVERFQPNVAQNILLDVWADLERDARAIHILELKARRLGVSTLSELAIAHRVQFHPYTNAVIASADPGKSILMADMVEFAWKQMPWWLMPVATKHKFGMPVEFGEIESGITVQAGNQFNGVARGATPNVYHVSEIAEWEDAERLIDASLMRAIIDSPNVFGIIEGTGEGKRTYFHNTWEFAKKAWAAGRGRQMPVFLPWYVGTDIYPSETEQRQRPIPTGWIPSDKTIRHAEKAREYVLANPLLFKYLAKHDPDWTMPRAQMWYREVEYENAKEAKTLNKFLSEMAGDDFEAFQSQNLPIIDPEIILNYQERTRQPKAVYTIIGPDIHPLFVAPRAQMDFSKPPITIKVRDVLPTRNEVYQFVPLRFTGYDTFDPMMKFLVWEEPSNDHQYGIGTDCGEGVQQDRSVIEVFREMTPDREAGQVAEWAYDRITAFQMWPLVLAIGCWYSVYSARMNRRAQTRLAIESFTNGSALQNELQKRGWINFHPWKYNDTRKPKPDGQTQRIGVFTNQWFRSQMMDMLLTCLSEEAVDLPSPYLVEELETLERMAGQKKIAAQYGEHDDRVMAFGFPLFSLHMNKPPHQQFTRKRVNYEPGLEEETTVYPIWTPPAQAQSLGPQPTQEVSRSLRGAYQFLRHVNRDMPRGFR